MKLCVLFPGIGYHCDKPLLYYAAKLAKSRGYEVIALRFTDFPAGAKGNEQKLREAAAHALTQSEQQLSEVCFPAYQRVVFIGKSIGTAAMLAYRSVHRIKADCILLTPLPLTLEYDAADCTALHGTADPWAQTAEIERLCAAYGVPLHKYADANHSLETGDVRRDIEYLHDAAEKIDAIL